MTQSIVAECWTCPYSPPEYRPFCNGEPCDGTLIETRHGALICALPLSLRSPDPITHALRGLQAHRAAGHDVRPVEVKRDAR